MEKVIGIVYSTIDGQTKKICEKLATELIENHKTVELCSIENFNGKVTDYETLIIGASIRYGKHRDSVKNFIVENKRTLEQINTAFFSVNLVARKSNKNTPETNPYLIKFLKTIDWRPDYLDVFAGTLDYKKYSLLDRVMIKLIMKITKGPVKSDTAIEFTDWGRVRMFSNKIGETGSSSSRKFNT